MLAAPQTDDHQITFPLVLSNACLHLDFVSLLESGTQIIVTVHYYQEKRLAKSRKKAVHYEQRARMSFTNPMADDTPIRLATIMGTIGDRM